MRVCYWAARYSVFACGHIDYFDLIFNMKIPDFSRTFFCNYCERPTNHWPLANGPIKNLEEAHSFKRDTFEVMQCRDCGNTTYCIDHWFQAKSMGGDPDIESTEYYPPLFFRLKPKWYSELDKKIRNILDEVYLAMDNHLFNLASTGIRTALDRLLVSKVGDVGSFEAKIRTLLEKDIIKQEEKDLLLAVIDAGSASAHRSFKPNKTSINDMMKIVEHIFYKICVESKKKESLLKKAKQLKNRTPKRK